MNHDEIIQSHNEACEWLHQLMLEENRFLKGARRVPEASLLDRKRTALTILSDSLDRLRAAGPAPRSPIPAHRAAMEKTQQLILKALLIDRENEQLLLGCTMRGCSPTAAARPAAAQLQRAYSRH